MWSPLSGFSKVELLLTVHLQADHYLFYEPSAINTPNFAFNKTQKKIEITNAKKAFIASNLVSVSGSNNCLGFEVDAPALIRWRI